jgi:hypothetical protein
MVDWWVGWGGEFCVPGDLLPGRTRQQPAGSGDWGRPRLGFGFGGDFWRSQHVSESVSFVPTLFPSPACRRGDFAVLQP